MRVLTLALVMLLPQFGETNDMAHLMDYGVKVHIVKPDNNEGSGSGVFIAKDLILTANHLFEDGAKYYTDNDHTQEAIIVKRDEENDLMLLRVQGKHRHASLGSMPKRMDEVLTVGYPMGQAYVMVYGRIADTTEDRLLIDSRVMRGMSGGGIFSAKRGQLIGICVSAWGDTDQQFMVAISVNVIREFTKGVK